MFESKCRLDFDNVRWASIEITEPVSIKLEFSVSPIFLNLHEVDRLLKIIQTSIAHYRIHTEN